MNDNTEWWEDRSYVTEFGRLLYEADILDIAPLIMDYFEKPWKWTPEHEAWVALDRPTPEGGDWDRFIRETA